MISIFVSSTFGDMQAERDVLRQNVLPRLQRRAAEFGESVRFIDLRWGVDTTDMSEENATKKIMDVCFEQIDKCGGKMLCLLGERYGWIPDYDAEKLSRRYGVILEPNASATELEIQYGILHRRQRVKTVAFFRNEIIDLPDEKRAFYTSGNERMKTLKQRLRNTGDCHCESYTLSCEGEVFTGLGSFADRVYAALCDYIAPDADLSMVPSHVRQKRLFDALIEKNKTSYYVIDDLLKAAENLFLFRSQYIVLKAGFGMGKTAFISYWYSRLQDRYPVFCFLCGMSAGSDTPQQLLTFLISHLCDYLHISVAEETGDFFQKKQLFAYLLEQTKEPVVFIIDGIDHLSCPPEERLLWLPEGAPETVRFFITTSDKDMSDSRLKEMGIVRSLSVPSLQKPERFIRYLLQQNGKQIDERILEKALGNHHIENYYHAKMISDALIALDRFDFLRIQNSGDGMNAINRYLTDAVAQLPESADGLTLYLLHDFGKRIAPLLVPEVYMYIACNEGGLRATDLEALFGDKWDDVSFETYVSYLSDVIVERENGCYDFSSPAIRSAVIELLDENTVRKVMAHLETLPDDDPIKLRCCLFPALQFEHYDAAWSLIKHNAGSDEVARLFIRSLMTQPDRCIILLSRYDLHEWFLLKVLPLVNTAQEREAGMRVTEAVLRLIPERMRHLAAEYIGDCLCGNSSAVDAGKYYEKALKLACGAKDRERLSRKLASVITVGSEQDYDKLVRTLTLSLNCRSAEQEADIADRIIRPVTAYRLMILKLNHELFGLLHLTRIENSGLQNHFAGGDQPYLQMITQVDFSRFKIEEHPSLQAAVGQYKKLVAEADELFENAKIEEVISAVHDYIELHRGYKLLNISDEPAEWLHRTKRKLEGYLHNSFSLRIYQELGSIEYMMAFCEELSDEQQEHLRRCCSIWEQFITRDALPEFTRSYIDAEKHIIFHLLRCGRTEVADSHTEKRFRAEFDLSCDKLRRALEACKKCPDEIHAADVDRARNAVQKCFIGKAEIELLGRDYELFELQRSFYQREWTVSHSNDLKQDFAAREEYVYMIVKWLKRCCRRLKERSVKNADEQYSLDLVLAEVLRFELRWLDLLFDIRENAESAVYFSLRSYHNERVRVLEEFHPLVTLRSEKIQIGYLYALALTEQAEHERRLYEENLIMSANVLEVLLKYLLDDEYIEPYLNYPSVSRQKLSEALGGVTVTLGEYYRQAERYDEAALAFEKATTLYLRLYGESEGAESTDVLFLRLAEYACAQAMEIRTQFFSDGDHLKLSGLFNKIKALKQ